MPGRRRDPLAGLEHFDGCDAGRRHLELERDVLTRDFIRDELHRERNGSFHFFAASYRTAPEIASAYVSKPDQVRTIRSPALKRESSASACSPTTRDFTVIVRPSSSSPTNSPDEEYVGLVGCTDCAPTRIAASARTQKLTMARRVQVFLIVVFLLSDSERDARRERQSQGHCRAALREEGFRRFFAEDA